MTPARLALAASAVLLAFMVGLATARAPDPAVQPLRSLRVADLRLDAPGPSASAAAAELAGSLGAPPPAVAAPAPPATARVVAVAALPPPPPQPDAVLRRSVTAVAEEGGRLGLVLAGAPGRRLHAGDAFMGWRIASVSRSAAVLVQGRQRRDVPFFGPPPATPGPTLGGPVLAAAAAPDPARAAPPTAAEYFRGFRN